MSYDHEVVIAGAGPTGLMLAGELALAGVDVVLVERRANQELAGSRAGGLHARVIEVLDQRGIADRFLAEGQVGRFARFGGAVLDLSDFPTRHPYVLALWQNHIERLLAGWVDELKVPICREQEVTGFTQDETGVEVQVSGRKSLKAKYLVGCDGGRSLVRKAAGIAFPGWDATISNLIAEVEMRDEPQLGIHNDARGVQSMGRLEDGRRVRMVLTESSLKNGEPTLEDLRGTLIEVYGRDFGVHSPTWISRFTDMARQAAAYRNGRVLLAGDAAHVHYPAGGQGLNIGLQDAVNLGWKLAQVVKGVSNESLLDTYHAERHPIAARALRDSLAAVALRRGDDRGAALGKIFTELLGLDQARQQLAGRISGLDICYELTGSHPLIGRRMPDFDLVMGNGETRVYTFLHKAQALVLNFAAPGSFDASPWAGRVKWVDARYEGVWELPVVGQVPAPAAVLIRPDGYVAWVGDVSYEGLAEALNTWFG